VRKPTFSATELVAEANVLRMAYIDSKIAELHHGARNDPTVDRNAQSIRNQLDGGKVASESRHAAGVGRLQEVDLGPTTTIQNIQRTEAATKRLDPNEEVPVEDQGKPGRWNRRRRRNSEDVRRDKLVEEVLRETRCKCIVIRSISQY
jgi:hypothetical protein